MLVLALYLRRPWHPTWTWAASAAPEQRPWLEALAAWQRARGWKARVAWASAGEASELSSEQVEARPTWTVTHPNT